VVCEKTILEYRIADEVKEMRGGPSLDGRRVIEELQAGRAII